MLNKIPLSLIAVAAVGLAGARIRANSLPSATQELLNQNAGMRAMFEGRSLVALYGVPFWKNDTNPPYATTDAFVQGFLDEHKDALGVVDLGRVAQVQPYRTWGHDSSS